MRFLTNGNNRWFVFLLVLLTSGGLIACTGTANNDQRNLSSPEQDQDGNETSEMDLPPHHFIREGMDVERVRSLVGEPDRKEQHSDRPDEWYYPFGILMIEEGKVQYKYPPSRSEKRATGEGLETKR